MADKPIKVILDTNFWISYLITDNFKFLDDFILQNKIKILFSDDLLEEFIEITSRPKFKKYYVKRDVEKLLEFFDCYGIFVEVNSNVKICRDPKDDFLLSLALDSKAEYLITGDKDLLELEKIGTTKIVTIKEFSKNVLSRLS